MPLKVNEFVIQAKVIEDQDSSAPCLKEINFPASVKKEIIDECLEKMKEYIERKQLRH